MSLVPSPMMSPRNIALIALALSLLSSLGFAQPAAPADQTAEARLHFDRGLTLFNQQNFVGALAEFRRAYELSARVSLLYNLGATYQALHQYPEAAAAIEEYLRRAENLQPTQRAQVQQALDQIRGFIAHVLVQTDPPDATVVLDDEVVSLARLAEPIPVSSGRHTISASASGRSPSRSAFEVASGDNRTITFRLERLPVAPTVAPRAAPTLSLRGVPAGASVELDGRLISAVAPVTVSAGSHRVSVRANGLDPWAGELRAVDGEQRVITLHLANTRGIRPEAFAIASVATGLLAAASVTFGLMTLSERANFSAFTTLSPEAEASADRGLTYRAVTNVMLGAATLSAIASVWLLTRTRFARPARSTVEIALAPAPSGALAALGMRF